VTSSSGARAEAAAPHSQTLSRGIRVLEILAESDTHLSIAEISAALGVHRSIAYRILRTLEDHGLVTRDAAGAVLLGPRMASLARSVSRDLQTAALPELTAVANELGMTAFVAVHDRDEVVTLVSVEPRHSSASVAQRPGTRHPLALGAQGVAIQTTLSARQLATLAPGQSRPDAVREARLQGFAVSHDEVIPGVSSIAVHLTIPGRPSTALAVVYIANGHDVAAVAGRLATAAAAICTELS
jgi:DNA-binding IclR family transcriptional regulator